MARPEAQFHVLGGVEVLRNGTPVKLGGPRQRALLALLLVAEGKVVRADRLIDELWHGKPPAGAAGTLQSYVSRLRSALAAAGAIVGTASAYTLDVDDESVDARRFERLVDEGHAALERDAAKRALDRFQAALALWKGAPFGDVGDEGSLRAEAERLADLNLRAREGLVTARLRVGAVAEVIDELESLVTEHPYRERLWHHLMLALYRAGRPADALAAFRRARKTLDELGLEPGDELRQLEGAILRHQVPSTPTFEERHNLPAPASTFFGRVQELEELEQVILASRLVTLTGVGGVGKTRLALEAARRVLPDFPEVVFVDLSTVSEPTGVVQRVAAALDVREQADVRLEDQIATKLGGGGLLLALDNCEHLREACTDLLGELLPRCPALHVLATSREFLGCDGETEYPVSPLETTDAVELFVARARAVRPRLADDERTRESAATICSDLDGLPLAIELAAARARALSLEEIESRLADRFRFLVAWRRLATSRHQTLERAMDWSYELLSPTEQTLLARLSVFAGGFTLSAAAAVGLEASEEETLPHLERLVDASLVIAGENEGSTRYRLLETVRQYGTARLEERGETGALRRLHARYYADILRKYREEARGSHGQWVEWTRPDYDNVIAALVWSRDEGSPEDQLDLAQLIWRFWWVRGSFAEGREWLGTAIERGSQADPNLRALAFEGAAGLAWAHGDNDRADDLAGEARRLFEETGDAYGELRVTTTLGHIALNFGQPALAAERFERTRALAVGPAAHALAVLNLGSAAQMAGEFDRAQLLYTEARDRYAVLDDRYGVALSRHLAGILAMEAGNNEDAAACVLDALPVFLEMGFAQYTWQCIETAAAIARARGDSAECARILGAAARLREGSGTSPAPWERVPRREREAAERELGSDVFVAAWDEGHAMTKDEAVARVRQLLGA
jgi:predicted ATPase/DNA-binding SARP family transcriptional activator